MLTAEAEREAAKQKVITVQVTSEADREAGKKLIAAKQVIEREQASRGDRRRRAGVHGGQESRGRTAGRRG